MECVIVSYSPFTVEFHCCGKTITKHYDVALLPLEIMREAEFLVFDEPEEEPTYQVVISTPKNVVTQTGITFKEAKLIQGVASLLVESTMGWQRQPSVDGIVEHNGFVLDMYAEGYIMIQLDKTE